MILAMMSVSEFFTAPAPLDTAAYLARENRAAIGPRTRVATIGFPGLSKHVRTVILLSCGCRPTEWPAENLPKDRLPLEHARFLREFLAEPGEKLVFADGDTVESIPNEVWRKWQIVACKSGYEDPDFGKWIRRGPRTLLSLIEGGRMTVYLLRPASGRGPVASGGDP